MNLLLVMSIITTVFALLTCVNTMANDSYPDVLVRQTRHNAVVPVLVYVIITICAAITLWETWKSSVVGVGAGPSPY